MEPTTVSKINGEAAAGPRGSRRGLSARRVSGPTDGSDARADRLVSELVRGHSVSMLATARRHSLCVDDAHEAWQRSIEILIRRAPTLDPVTATGWLRTVVKHEAMAVRAERTRFLGHAEFDPDCESGSEDPVERSERLERLSIAAEALAQLKPHEAEALMLLASGLSYREIASTKGWTYTKVNRLITEGRRAFRRGAAEIEAGAACTRWSPTLTRIADGEATEAERAQMEPHLQRCTACRAALRADRESRRSLGLLIPGVAAADGLDGEPRFGLVGVFGRWVSDFALTIGIRAQAAVETVSASKVAAVAASSAVLAGGGVAAQHAIDRRIAAVQPASAAAAVPDPSRPEWGAGHSGSQTRVSAVRETVPAQVARGEVAGDRTTAAAHDQSTQPSEFDPIGADPDPVDAPRAHQPALSAAKSAPVRTSPTPHPRLRGSAVKVRASKPVVAAEGEFGP